MPSFCSSRWTSRCTCSTAWLITRWSSASPTAPTTFTRTPRPLTLFVLNPLEVAGFGALWLLVLVAYSASIEGILIYLAINLVFGLVAHVGVEPAPEKWLRIPVLRYVSTSTFHSEHHMDRFHNYGFYLLLWDRLFRTLSPEYAGDFARRTRISLTT